MTSKRSIKILRIAVMGVVLETGLALSHIAFDFGDGAASGVLPKELRLLDHRVERIDLAGCAAAAVGRRRPEWRPDARDHGL